jgi:ribose transport system ATP-binding protein
MNDAILKLNAVGKRFPGVVALRDVSLEVRRGDAHVLLGENGAGKSTLINLLAGIYVPDEGEIVFDGKPYRPRTPLDAYGVGIRVVHQELSMLSQLTVAENLLFESLPQRHGLVNFREMNRRAAELLQEVGLDIAPNIQVSRLGVAQMQLVEIAKALCYDSKLLILDEPTATLTSKEVERLFEILKKLKSKGVTILYISHRLQEIYEIGDAVTVLRDGQVVETRPLAGLTIPDIVRMMVGRSVRDEDAFRDDVASTANCCASKACSAAPARRRCRLRCGGAKLSAWRASSAAAAPRPCARCSAPTPRSPATSSSRARRSRSSLRATRFGMD